MSFLTSLLGGGGGSGSIDDAGSSGGGGVGNFLQGMGTGFVNGRLGPNNPFTGKDPLSNLFSSMISQNGQSGNASAAGLPPTDFGSNIMAPPPKINSLVNPTSNAPLKLDLASNDGGWGA